MKYLLLMLMLCSVALNHNLQEQDPTLQYIQALQVQDVEYTEFSLEKFMVGKDPNRFMYSVGPVFTAADAQTIAQEWIQKIWAVDTAVAMKYEVYYDAEYQVWLVAENPDESGLLHNVPRYIIISKLTGTIIQYGYLH